MASITTIKRSAESAEAGARTQNEHFNAVPYPFCFGYTLWLYFLFLCLDSLKNGVRKNNGYQKLLT